MNDAMNDFKHLLEHEMRHQIADFKTHEARMLKEIETKRRREAASTPVKPAQPIVLRLARSLMSLFF